MTTTRRQQQVLDAIRAHIQKHGMPPTLRELMPKLGIGHPNGVRCHLRALKRKGLIEWEPNQARTLRPIEDKSLPLVTLESLSR